MASETDTARFLVERGLIAASQMVDGPDVTLRDASRRNRNIAVWDEPALFVKSAVPDAVRDEAAAYARLAAQCPELAGLVPDVVLADPAAGIIVLERLGGQDLRRFHVLGEAFPRTIAPSLGSALGVLHSRTRRTAEPVYSDAPLALELHRPGPADLVELSSGSLDLIAILQGQQALCDRLDLLRRSWRPECLIHGDLRWDNLLIRPGDIPLGIVDWEHAGDGDPCWDVGCVLAAPLSAWAFSVPHTSHDPPAPMPERARRPLAEMRPAFQSFWRAYTRTAGPTPEPAEIRERAVALAGVRLIQTAFEGTQAAGVLEASLVVHVQLGMNLVLRPADAARDLLGLATR